VTPALRPTSFATKSSTARIHPHTSGKRVLPRWGHRDFTTISRADVIALIERLVTAGKPILANRTHALVSAIFSFAIDADLINANPAARLRKRGAERIKTRVLSDEEIRLFWARSVLPPVSRPVGLALRLILLTGVRAGEVAGMGRAELELGGDGKPVAWTIPGDRSKNGRAHYVPLSPMASALIGEALTLAGEGAFVFLSRVGYGSIEGHALAVAIRRLGASIPNYQPGAESWKADPPTCHDLRRSVATRLSAAGTPAEDVAAILNHVRTDVTGRHYDQYRRADEKRRALDRWARILSVIVKPSPATKIIPLR
jgi:integrase